MKDEANPGIVDAEAESHRAYKHLGRSFKPRSLQSPSMLVRQPRVVRLSPDASSTQRHSYLPRKRRRRRRRRKDFRLEELRTREENAETEDTRRRRERLKERKRREREGSGEGGAAHVHENRRGLEVRRTDQTGQREEERKKRHVY